MWIVMWWDAYGDAHMSEKMGHSDAVAFRDSMHQSQEARLVFINAPA